MSGRRDPAMRRFIALLLAAAAALATGTAAAQQLLRNGGFEEGLGGAEAIEAYALLKELGGNAYAIGTLQLKNRLVIAPMCQYSCEHGEANDWHLIHLGQLALSGAALLILEATA